MEGEKRRREREEEKEKCKEQEGERSKNEGRKAEDGEKEEKGNDEMQRKMEATAQVWRDKRRGRRKGRLGDEDRIGRRWRLLREKGRGSRGEEHKTNK